MTLTRDPKHFVLAGQDLTLLVTMNVIKSCMPALPVKVKCPCLGLDHLNCYHVEHKRAAKGRALTAPIFLHA